MSEVFDIDDDNNYGDNEFKLNIDGDIAAGIRWDPLGEEKDNSDAKLDEVNDERYVKICFVKL